jgi:hypothetical protein
MGSGRKKGREMLHLTQEEQIKVKRSGSALERRKVKLEVVETKRGDERRTANGYAGQTYLLAELLLLVLERQVLELVAVLLDCG